MLIRIPIRKTTNAPPILAVIRPDTTGLWAIVVAPNPVRYATVVDTGVLGETTA
jgi:hypothetical protein